ncbi:MAG: hypothetical protein KKD53_06195, partial [Proteobacteria bacterium]|nr:hypothetical protein [Pseudomonadota bacterium]
MLSGSFFRDFQQASLGAGFFEFSGYGILSACFIVSIICGSLCGKVFFGWDIAPSCLSAIKYWAKCAQ